VLKGFREFILRGNVVDLAVAVVIGAAFNAIVAAFSKKIIGGLLGAIGGTPNFDAEYVTLNGSRIFYGTVITATINFLIVAGVVYFVIVVPMKRVHDRFLAGEEEAPAVTDEAKLLTEIRDLLKERAHA
jgi:large conductance mechanosensitive channel